MKVRVYLYVQSAETLDDYHSAAMGEMKKAHGDIMNRLPDLFDKLKYDVVDDRNTIYIEFDDEAEAAVWKLTHL